MKKTIALAFAATLVAGSAQALPTPAHMYEFTSNLSDGMLGPAMVAGTGSSFTGNGETRGLRFAFDQGPTLTNGFANPGLYSIEMFFSLDALGFYRRLIDFKNGEDDAGLYLHNGDLQFYGKSGAIADTNFAPGQMVHLVLTRDASEKVRAYAGGVELFSFNDTGATPLAEFTEPGGVAHFFRDDGNGEASSGFVDFIRIYDSALGASDVAALYNGGTPFRGFEVPTVPEPAIAGLFGLGFAGLGLVRRRRATA